MKIIKNKKSEAEPKIVLEIETTENKANDIVNLLNAECSIGIYFCYCNKSDSSTCPDDVKCSGCTI